MFLIQATPASPTGEQKRVQCIPAVSAPNKLFTTSCCNIQITRLFDRKPNFLNAVFLSMG